MRLINQENRTCRLIGILARAAIAAFITTLAILPSQATSDAEVQLGARLFAETGFATPRGDLHTSCSHCHLLDEDPQGHRDHTDFFSRSWIPYRLQDPRREELRNTPTLSDVAAMPRLHFDGEFDSLENLVKGTIAGRPFGWLPGEEAKAFEHVRNILLNSRDYRREFKSAYGVDLERLTPEDTMNKVSIALSAYLRGLKTTRTSSYDRFVRANNLDPLPHSAEPPAMLSRRIFEELSALESKGSLKLTPGFGREALMGFKIFLRSDAGNCASCHVPPLFTDFSFHNIGISQAEYDGVHGQGRFNSLQIPFDSQRPAISFREIPSRNKPEYADLGFWNFVDVVKSPLRKSDETANQFLERMIGTFKTPTLRNLRFSNPYMHNGRYPTLQDAISAHTLMASMARSGKVRAAAQELSRIVVNEREIEYLVALLDTLNENRTNSARLRRSQR